MQLTVHIGTTKTGTSSIQRYIHDNRDLLLLQGAFVPKSLGAPTHTKAAVASLPFGKSPDLARLIPIRSEAEHASFKANTRQAFKQEVSPLPDSTHVVISVEFLHSRVTSPEEIAEFKTLFCSGFDRVEILLYIRPQLDHIVSLYSTVLRAGNRANLDRFITSRTKPEQRPYFDIRDIITRWTDQFSRDNITVRPYNAISGSLGVVGDFCQVIGIDPSANSLHSPQKANRSISASGQELLRLVNRSDPSSQLRRQVVAWAEENCPGPGAEPDIRVARRFQEQFAESNAWVVSNYFPDHPEYLEPRWPKA